MNLKKYIKPSFALDTSRRKSLKSRPLVSTTMASRSTERRSYTVILFWARLSSQKGAQSRWSSDDVLCCDMLALLGTSNYEHTNRKSAGWNRGKARVTVARAG